MHLEDTCLLDVAPKAGLLATYGVDNLIFTIDPSTEVQRQYQLGQTEVYQAMALAPDGSHCVFGTHLTIQLTAVASSSLTSKTTPPKPWLTR